MARLDVLLRHMVTNAASDLHLGCGAPPRVRVNGQLVEVPGWAVLDDLEVGRLMVEVTPPDTWRAFTKNRDADFAYALPGVARFRVNLYQQVTGRGAVLRTIPETIIPLQDLKVPPGVESLADLHEGLVVVTGPTGSGKSTTVAALVDVINRKHARHIVTIEDPVEFIHQDNLSFFSHREVGRHTGGFAQALRAATRQGVDVLVVGELRDQETVGLAVAAAEMGLLVFATAHTNGAAKTIDRLLDAFPAAQQAQVRLALGDCLAGVVSQVLVRRVDGRGRVVAAELLLRNPAVANIIRENNTAMLYSIMQSGRAQGMVTMDQTLHTLLSAGTISREDAVSRATDRALFERSQASAAFGKPITQSSGAAPAFGKPVTQSSLPAAPGVVVTPPKR